MTAAAERASALRDTAVKNLHEILDHTVGRDEGRAALIAGAEISAILAVEARLADLVGSVDRLTHVLELKD